MDSLSSEVIKIAYNVARVPICITKSHFPNGKLRILI